MQKENPVIKNYILSSEKYNVTESITPNPSEISLYHLPLEQNKDLFFLFLLRK